MLGGDLWEWRRLARGQRTPLHVILFVTDHCNARCGTCFYWQNLNQGESLQPDHIERISDSLDAIRWLDISGGEPFLRRDLAAICHRFVRHNGARFLNIPTNAIQTETTVRITSEILSVAEPIRLNVAISLDGIGENHDRVRGVPGNYVKAMATLTRLSEIRRNDPRLALSVVTTVMRHNVDDVRELLRLGVEQWDLNYHSLNILRGAPMDANLQPPTREQFAEVSRIQVRQCRRYFRGRYGVLWGWLTTAGRYALNRYYLKELEGRPKDIACNAGRISCVIDANGDVYFCELLRKVGNLKDYNWDFQRLWYDFEAQQLRARVGHCHCTHECFHTKNLIFTPLQML